MSRVVRSCQVLPLPILATLVVGLVFLPLIASRAADEQTPYTELAGFAMLPADTFAAGPPAGFALDPQATNGRRVPFDSQPVQGVSAVLPQWNGHWLVMSDNGFGSKGNSADYRLRWYEIAPDFDAGTVAIVGYTELSDPNGYIPWPIVNGTSDRVLTGADFDVESFRQAPDGSFWFGDEFGPYLLHTDAMGRLLSAPIPTPYPDVLAAFARGRPFIQSPENADFSDLAGRDAQVAAANLPTSRGFEGMALNASGSYLYPLLEGALVDDTVRTRLLIQEFSPATLQYTGRYWFYPLSDAGHAIGDMTAINDYEFLVIERDNNQGLEARFKRIYKVDLRLVGEDGLLQKHPVADLMAIADVHGLTTPQEGTIGFGPVFSLPFVTIESVYPIDSTTLLVINDNNYPFSTGRRPGLAPDDNEFILLRLADENELALPE